MKDIKVKPTNTKPNILEKVGNVPKDVKSVTLASHTFITGSTGSGKSNTVYKILVEALNTIACIKECDNMSVEIVYNK